MSQHDFDIANQTAPNTRADLNLALKALASTSSGASAPATTYANMLYYNTTDNKLYKRNEADSGWISLGVVDESLGFTPSNPKKDVGIGADQTWKSVSRSLDTSYQNTTGKPIKVAAYQNSGASTTTLRLEVSTDNSTWLVISLYRSGFSTTNTVSEIIPNNHYYKYTSTDTNTLIALELS
jgi:hypothetical protein